MKNRLVKSLGSWSLSFLFIFPMTTMVSVKAPAQGAPFSFIKRMSIPPPAVVQSGFRNYANGVWSDTITISPTKAGNTLVVFVGNNYLSSVTSIVDNASGGSNSYVWTGTTGLHAPGAVTMHYAKNIKAGVTSITATIAGASTGLSLWVAEVSGLDKIDPFVGDVASALQLASTTMTAVNFLNGMNRGMVFSVGLSGGAISGINGGSPFTSMAVNSDGDGVAYYVHSAKGSYGAIWNQGSSDAYATYTGVFKAANGTYQNGGNGSPTFVREVETLDWLDSANAKDTPPFAVKAGDVLVAYGGMEGDSLDQTIAGGSLTWTQQQTVNVASYSDAKIWTAVVDTDKTMTVTFTKAAGTVAHGGNVLVFRNSSGVGASSKANVSGAAPTLNITTTKANSAIVVFNADWNAVSGAARTWRTNAGAFTEASYEYNSINYTIYGGYHPNAGAIGTYAVGLSAPAGQKYSIVAVEIKGP